MAPMQANVSPSTPPPECSETQREQRFKLLDALAIKAGWVDTPLLPERMQAAERLRERLCTVPFYANRAAKVAAQTGDEMDYWLELQASQPTAHRRSSGCLT